MAGPDARGRGEKFVSGSARCNLQARPIAKWAIDIQISDGVNPASIHRAFADQGVSLSRVFKEKGHYHVEGSRSDAAKGENAAAAAAKAKLHDDNAFGKESDGLNRELLAAQRALVTDTTERARIAAEQVKEALRDAKNAIDAELSEGKITKAQAAILRGKQDAIAAQKLDNIEVQTRREIEHQSVEIANNRLGIEAEHLKALDELAVSTSEHRTIQRSIVEKMSQIEINAAQEALSSAEASKNAYLITVAQDMLAAAYQRRTDAVNQSDRRNASPGQAYLQRLHNEDTAMKDRLDEIKVQGLDSLNSGLVEAILGTKKLGSVFHDISKQIIGDLLQIAVRRAIVEPLANALFGGSSGSGGGGGGGGLFGSILGAASSLFGGGRSFSAPNFGNSFQLSPISLSGGTLQGLAVGGPMAGGKPYLVGERGPEIVVPRASGVVIPNHRAFGGGQQVVVNINAQDAVLSHTVRGWIMEGMTAAADAGGDVAISRSGRMNRRVMP